MTDRALVLSAWEDRPETLADLREIAGRVERVDPSIAARVVAHHTLDELRLLPFWFRPALSVSLVDTRSRKLLPGHFIANQRLGKIAETERLQRAGIPVPRWTVIGPETRLDPAEWGPYVVEKPSRGRRGAYVRVRKTGRVRYVPPESLPPDHHGRRGPMLAQVFVYTGPWPASYRVLTLFGETLVCYRQLTRGRGEPLSGRFNFRENGGRSIVSNTLEMEVSLADDADVLALAERAHREAFPDVPLVNLDVIRDADTGELWVLEANCGGGWHFSSEAGLGIQGKNGINFETQFGAFDRAARILAERTRRLGERRAPFGAEARR